MKGIKPGQFVYCDSFMNKLDPRTKIICSLAIIFSVLMNDQWPVILFDILLITTGIFLSRMKITKVFSSLNKLKYLFLLTFIFQAILTPGEPVFHLGSLGVSREGISLGMSTLFRLLILYLCSTLLTATTSPLKLASGIESLLSPLSCLRIPIHQFSMLISISLRFIPTIIEETEILTRAQRSRGAPFNSPNILVRLKSMIAVLIPLLAASLQRANDLAVAMESRCYSGGSNQLRVSDLRLGKNDKLLILFGSLMIIVFAGSVFLL